MMALLVVSAALAAASLDAEMRAVAALPGEPAVVSAAGLAEDTPVSTLENHGAFDVRSTPRRLVIIGGFAGDEPSASKAIALVRWFKTTAPASLRRQWMVSALPMAAFGAKDSASLQRWIAFQAPDVLVEIRSSGAPAASASSAAITPTVVSPAISPAELAKILASAPPGFSALRASMVERVKRTPLDIAKALATRYPETPSISYIPAVAWTSTLRLAKQVKDEALERKVREQTAPWISGGRPLFGDRILLTSIAGTMVFAELGGDAARLAAEGARLAAARTDSGMAQYGQGWTDDMFMSSAILSRTHDFDAAASLLKDYAARLQRADGVFMHATDGPFAWGRGNGFAALGLAELLAALPPSHAARGDLLAIYRRLMAGVLPHQAPDGMWRQLIDEPGSYREETATAMLLTAMQRGVRLGWLPRSYAEPAARAWNGLKAHVAVDATLIDVCTGTGAGPTRRYYLDRAAITGADDRGGAMALLAAMEMIQ